MEQGMEKTSHVLELWRSLNDDDKTHLVAFMRQLLRLPRNTAGVSASEDGEDMTLHMLHLWSKLSDDDRENLTVFLPHPYRPSLNPLDRWCGPLGNTRGGPIEIVACRSPVFSIKEPITRLKERIGFLHEISRILMLVEITGPPNVTLKAFIMQADVDRLENLVARLSSGLRTIQGGGEYISMGDDDTRLCTTIQMRVISALDFCRVHGIFKFSETPNYELQHRSPCVTDPRILPRGWDVLCTLMLFWDWDKVGSWYNRPPGLPSGRLVVLNGFPGTGKLTILNRLKDFLPHDKVHIVDSHKLIDLVHAVHPERSTAHYNLRRSLRREIFLDIRQHIQKGHTVLMTACLANNTADTGVYAQHLEMVRGTITPIFWLNVSCNEAVLAERVSTTERRDGPSTKLTDVAIAKYLAREHSLLRPFQIRPEPVFLAYEELDVSGTVEESVDHILEFLDHGLAGIEREGSEDLGGVSI